MSNYVVMKDNHYADVLWIKYVLSSNGLDLYIYEDIRMKENMENIL